MIVTDDLTFLSESFSCHWRECIEQRPHYIYLLPMAEEAGDIVVYFSSRPWQPGDIIEMCQGSQAPLESRWTRGEEPLGFRCPLAEVELKARSPRGRTLLKEIGYVNAGAAMVSAP